MRSGEAAKIFLAGHRLLPLFIFILIGSFSGLLRSEAQTLVPQEVKALKQIGAKLGMRWNFNVDPCSRDPSWLDPHATKDYGANVTCSCNPTTKLCHVTIVVLKTLGLPGTLPSEFANLTSLTVLDLSRNYLNGSIPVEWASLPLTDLSLLGNRISGRIPDEFGKITTLLSFVVENNLIEGPIPESLGNLRNLQRLFLTANNITGELPESLGKLRNLTDFRIDGNPISGKIPSFMGNWTQLYRLDMQGTSLEGPFPPIFSTLSSIAELRVTDLELKDGKFPPLENMKNMQRLVLRNLSISGTLPEYIGEMSNLKFIDLSYNNLTGPIPENFANLRPSLNFMFLTDNNLTGSIPRWISSSSQTLDLSFNSFSDTSGLPSFCPQGSVNLFSSFSTTDSDSLSACYRRNFPCSEKANNYNFFINCGGPALQVGDVLYEGDDTSVPAASRFEFSASGKWAFSSTGSFIGNDSEKFITTNASVLNMPDPELYMTARLSPLSLKYYGLCLHNGNYTVSLHFAEIMFASDHSYSSTGRRYFDVSVQGNKVLRDYNIAERAKGNGRKIIENFTAIVDDHTLEIHFQWEGKGTNAVPRRGVYGPLISAISVTSDFEPDREKSKLSTAAIVGIAVGAVFVAIMLIILLFIRLFLRRKNAENEELRRRLESSQTGYFTLKQIKSATKNFDPSNKIGEGGFGPVYKGVLQDGSAIAVKQLSSKSRQGNREFINEIGMISALQHPNLVKLLGCCIEGNQLLLVYEYMENNSLARALFGPEKNRINLDWQTRRNICLGIARGLAYLHEESGLRIVHRDIKATNVLLDKELNAKISDFGLARLSEEEETHISTRIAGTIGYMAPEYAMRGYLTDKADVYSFGVVMLETVSGMNNTNYRPKEDFVYLLDWAYVLQEQGNLLELVDQKLDSNYSKEEALHMLNLALVCTSPSPTLRPTMSAVVSMLDGKKHLKVPNVKKESTTSDDGRFKAFEKLSQDSQSPSISMDGPWVDSSVSVPTSQEHTEQTSRLLSDFSE